MSDMATAPVEARPHRSGSVRRWATRFALGLAAGVAGMFFLADAASASHGRGTDLETSIDASGVMSVKMTDRTTGSCVVSVDDDSNTVEIWGATTSAMAEYWAETEDTNLATYVGSLQVDMVCSRSLGTAVEEYSGSATFDITTVTNPATSLPYEWYGVRYSTGNKVSNIVNSGGGSSDTDWSAQSVVRYVQGQRTGSPVLNSEIPLAMNPAEGLSQVLALVDPDGGTTSAITLVDGTNPPVAPDFAVTYNILSDGSSTLAANSALPGNQLIIPANVAGFETSTPTYIEFKLRVFDDDGEYSEYGYVIIPSTNTAPVISRTVAAGVFSATVTNGATVVWDDIQAVDGGGSPSGATFTLGGAPTWVSMQTTASAGSTPATAVLTFSPAGLEPGTYYLSLNAQDNDGTIPLTSTKTIAITIPESPVLTPGDTQIVANWSEPASPGGTVFDYAIRYRSSTDGGQTWTAYTTVNPVTNSATPLSATLTGLTNGTLYSVEFGWNVTDGGAYSWSAESWATPGLVAGLDFPAPTGVLAGASAIPSTTVTPSALNVSFVSSTTSVCRVGLDGRTVSYITPGTCTLTATAQAGDVSGTYYLASAGVTRTFTVATPTVPSAPTITQLRSTPTGFVLDFTVPSDGGSALTNMEYSIDGAGWTAMSPATTASPLTITHAMTPSAVYTLEVRARNSIGTSAGSAAVSVSASTPPSAPAITSLVSQPFGYIVNFSGPTDSGGAPITAYQFRVNGGSWATLSASVTTSPLTISGLAQGVVYTVEIRAVNIAGGGAVSNAITQRTVIPPPPPAPPVSGPVVVVPPAGPGVGEPGVPDDGGDPDAGDGDGVPGDGDAGDGDGVPGDGVPGDGVPGDPADVEVPVVPSPIPDPVREPLFDVELAPVPVPVNAALPVVAPGASQALEDGVFVDVVIERPVPTRWTMSGGDFEWSLDIPPSPGIDGGSADGVVTLVRDRTVAVGGFGFAPNTWVDVWILPNGEPVAAKGLTLASVDPIYLGRVLVGPDGSFAGDLPVPASIPDGQHTLQANGRSFDDEVRSLNLGVQVLSADLPAVRLPATGSSTSVIWSALALIGLGAMILRRRERVSIAR